MANNKKVTLNPKVDEDTITLEGVDRRLAIIETMFDAVKLRDFARRIETHHVELNRLDAKISRIRRRLLLQDISIYCTMFLLLALLFGLIAGGANG